MNSITFSAEYSEVLRSCGTPIYLDDEQSLSYAPFDSTADFSIMLGTSYVGLDVDSQTGLVSQISGFAPKREWIERALRLPLAPKGNLYAHLGIPAVKGAGARYEGKWPIYFCSTNGCLCIGSPAPKIRVQRVQFCNGIIAELKNSKIVSLWVALKDKGRQGDGSSG